MNNERFEFLWKIFLPAVILVSFFSCKSPARPVATDIVEIPEKISKEAGKIIAKSLEYSTPLLGKLDDSISIRQLDVVKLIYHERGRDPLWSEEKKWLPMADSLFAFIEGSMSYGLFPADYHRDQLASIRARFARDTASVADRKDAALWARGDLMLSDAFVQLVRDIKWGRIAPDSVSLRPDTVINNDFFLEQYNILLQTRSVSRLMATLEPSVHGYHDLKAGIPAFLQQANFSPKTFVKYPDQDTMLLKATLFRRLQEGRYIDSSARFSDTVIHDALLRFQKENMLTADGLIGKETSNALNRTDQDRFLSIAITLDRYKMMPEIMPDKYIIVNIPGYNMQLWQHDSVILNSRVVVGKPFTRTPVLNSSISEMITYPLWNIPASIVEKEILPGLKKDPSYLDVKGYSLVGNEGEEVDPYLVDWTKFKKTIPYKIIQGSGDANALGVLKFNFYNKYAVYLHDTNQRYFFSRSSRALSHGCVRVQKWDDLMYFILKNDSTVATENNNRRYTPSDSVYSWLVRKEKHYVPVRNRIPIYIRYFTCAGRDGKIEFYDDIYSEDARIRDRYFAGK